MEYLHNKKAHFDYSFEYTLEAGIELLGSEVKSLKHNHGSINGAYVSVVAGELFLLGAHIPAWQEKNSSNAFDPYRTRKLLVHKKELYDIGQSLKNKGLTAVPVSLYNKNGKIKLQIAIAKGKKNFDKRDSLRDNTMKRDIARVRKGLE